MLRSERGLTLTEVTVVGVLATIVMLGIMSFYITSQGTWMDASAQAITQREATALIENMTKRVHAAYHAQSNATQLELFDQSENSQYVFWWNTGVDSLVHEGPGPGRTQDRGPSATSVCEQFTCAVNLTASLIDIKVVLRSAQGQKIELSTRVAMANRRPPS